MPTPKKYTRAFVTQEVESMLFQLQSNPSIFLLGELIEHRSYTHQRFSEWRSKFKDDEFIQDTMDKIKGILELRLNKQGLLGNLNSKMVVFNLINNYDWKNKTEVKQDVSMGPESWLSAIAGKAKK